MIEQVKKIAIAICEIEDSFCFEHNLSSTNSFSIEPKIAVNIKSLSRSDWEAIFNTNTDYECQQLKVIKEIVYERLDNNNVCIGALIDNKLCGYGWISEYEYDYSANIPKKNKSTTAYFFDSYILPEYRRKCIASAINCYWLRLLGSHNCKKIIGLVAKSNVANQIVLRKLGFSVFGRLVVLTLFRTKKIIIRFGIKKDTVSLIECLRGRRF